ncbi:MAG: hypothetical protein ABII18_01710 [bacterium]|nr:hypothetical protein [bacterium]MBU1918794.1 hypothetical protein [bacterium]
MKQKDKKQNLPLSENLHETLLVFLLIVFLCVSFFYIFSEIKAPLFQTKIQLNIVPQSTLAHKPYQYQNYHNSLALLAAHRDQLMHDDFIKILAQANSLKALIEASVREDKWDSRISYLRSINKKNTPVTQQEMWVRLKEIIVSEIDKDNQAILITLSDRNALLVEALTDQLPKIYQGILDRRNVNEEVTKAYEQTIQTELEEQRRGVLVAAVPSEETVPLVSVPVVTSQEVAVQKELLSHQLKELQEILISENKYVPAFLGDHLAMNALHKDIEQNTKVVVAMQQANETQTLAYRNAESNLKLLQSLYNSEVQHTMKALQNTYAQVSLSKGVSSRINTKQNSVTLNPALLGSMGLKGIAWPLGNLSSFSIQKTLSLMDADARGLNYIFVIVFSLLLSLMIFGIKYLFLSKLHAAHDVENFLQVPVLGVIPNKKKA